LCTNFVLALLFNWLNAINYTGQIELIGDEMCI